MNHNRDPVIRVLGEEELQANLNGLINKIPPEVTKALMDGGMSIERSAKKLVPVKTGRLRGSIRTDKISNEEVHVGTDVEYSGHVEFGTIRQHAQPYLRPAYDELKNKIISMVRKAVKGVTG